MPGTTRYSATFDRTYEEEDPPPAPPVNRRSRSQSLQAESITGSRGRYGPLFAGSQAQHARSSSTENTAQGSAPKGAELIPTRNAGKTAVKAHNNPFQFVKVGTCPLYKKAEEQLKKVEQVKKTPVIKEEEEEWQSNLDSWKLRRRKMSEGAFRRQEELRRLELEEQTASSQQQQKKIKTFSEIVEERAHRGRTLSLCLFSNPLESSDWVFESKPKRHSQDLLSEESAESSNINSEDENDNYQKQESGVNNNKGSKTENGLANEQNGIRNSTSNSSISKNSDLSELDVSQESINHKENNSCSGFIDSGLESLSSSHRTGDIPDSGSDFSQDSGSSIDCDSPRVSGLITTGIELLEEFSSKEEELPSSAMICQKEKSSVPVASEKVNTELSSTKTCDSNAVSPKDKVSSPKITSKKKVDTKAAKNNNTAVPKCKKVSASKQLTSKDTSKNLTVKPEKSVESENEMYVDDFEELARLENGTTESSKSVCSESKKQSKLSKKELTSSDFALNDNSLNIIYQSQTSEKVAQGVHASKKNAQEASEKNENNFSLISEIPVEKVTEQMERLILEQLEEEERAKEMSLDVKCNIASSCDEKSDLEIPVRKVEPPKEKPPPPPTSSSSSSTPNSASTKDHSVKRVNSTKRIIKEIHKRRSDFLGIDSSKQENSICEETSVPPPPALEDILRAEREHDRLRRQMLETESASQTSPEEDELARKEREIIENLETEERRRLTKDQNSSVPDYTGAHIEEERIKQLKEERKRMEEEIAQAEEQRIRMEEAMLLQKREKQIKEQEALKSAETSTALSSIDVHATNTDNDKTPSAVSNANLGQNGDGKIKQYSVSSSSSEVEVCKNKEPPPPVPAKPLKKKEALRKERERLRQEQEALQREREEHRRKVQLENEQLKKSLPNSHVLDAPVSQVGSLPPAKPALSSQVLTSPSPTSSSSSSHTLREMPGPGLPSNTKSTVVGSPSAGLLPQAQSKSASSKNRGPLARSKVSSELRTQQKGTSRKPESSVEPRYNQNHWLIQEAEMRRITEQKERQRAQNNPTHFHPAHYPEEYSDVLNTLQRPIAAQNVTVKPSGCSVPGQVYSTECYGQQYNHSNPNKLCMPLPAQHIETSHFLATYSKHFEPNLQPPAKPSRVPLEKQEQMLSVSGRKRCSHCGDELGRGAAMIIESLQLYYHIHCFRCCVCQAQLGNGSCGTDVRVRSNKLHCHNCYSNDEAGLKFSQV